MNCCVPFQLILFIVFPLVDSWLFWDPKSTKIWETAKSKIGSTEWSKAGTWNGKFAGLWKCNLFVYDVLKEATRGGELHILANNWANPNSKSVLNTKDFKLVEKKPRKGNIIAFKRIGESGHVGIVSTNGMFISALRKIVGELNIQDFIKDETNRIVSTTVWRYVGP